MSEPDEAPEGAAPAKKKFKDTLPVEEKIDSVLHVDRTAAPVYPAWMKAPLHPELELKGPAEYDLKSNIEISFLPGQGDEKFTGMEVYEHLKSNNLLDGCLGLADGYALRERGIKAYVKFFEAKDSSVVALWTGVFKDDDGKLYVPLAMPVLNKVAVTKGDLSVAWTKYRPLVRFK